MVAYDQRTEEARVDEQPVPGGALAGGAFALLAVALELLGSVLGDGESTTYPGWLAPVVWPTALRVTWWVLASAGAAAASHGLARATGRPNRVRTALVAAPFVAFAVAVALGLPVATWH